MDKEQRIEELCRQIRTGSNELGSAAIKVLRAEGWLTDGSLSRASLYEANLSGADLRGAKLSNAYMRGANLTEAVLHYADLSRVNLRHSVLSYADLRRANLSGASLNAAVLRGSALTDTDFTEAIFDATVLADVDLSHPKGLETTHHRGPSHISADTLFRSQGKIPEVFLRGCGVPEALITYLPSMIGKAIEYYSCFISYSHAQKDFARRLDDRLQGAGIRCWLDEHQMAPGQDIYEEVNRGIRLWDKVLLCCSKESLSSWWVDNEIGTAFEKEQQLHKERGKKVRAIIPLDLDGYLFNWKSPNGYESQLRRRLAADFNDWKNEDAFEKGFASVLKALQTDEGREVPPPQKL